MVIAMNDQDSAERSISPPVEVVAWTGDAANGHLRLLDQRRLPTETEFLDCRDALAVWDAIRSLAVRGAPAIGVAAGYGMVVAAQKLTAEAALTGDYKTALQAFIQDPQSQARLSMDSIEKLLQELLRAHADHLPQFA